MPTILLIAGWRFFFYANEGNEPIHIHVQKAEMDGKFWLKVDEYEITEAYTYNFSPAAKKEIRKIIFEHFDYIVNEWNNFFKK